MGNKESVGALESARSRRGALMTAPGRRLGVRRVERVPAVQAATTVTIVITCYHDPGSDDQGSRGHGEAREA